MRFHYILPIATTLVTIPVNAENLTSSLRSRRP